MNYGKFFRLNQRTSKIEDGVAIYDYIDLPAYFEASESNEMSPKYPISVAITEDSVRFRVHYSAYKIEKEWEQKPNYIYKVEKAYEEDFVKRNSKDRNNRYEIKKDIKHMEEVVLRLPYANDSTDELYQTIKEVYTSRYPFSLDNKTTLIYELIKKRYRGGCASSLEKDLYKKLRESMDGDSSYSTLWLMDIAKKEGDVNSINLFEGDIVVKFLRKMLLDFMFDLKHSDVFQTSKYYQAMYSGLMSNYYFSALMHKCEYYFYRGLINDVIKKNIEKAKEQNNDKENTIKRHIRHLYAEELFEAETLWIHDIMNPSSEKYFEHNYNGYEESNEGRYAFRNWNSWFASPEEEMRRVCFTMKEKEQTEDAKDAIKFAHICNAETLAEYLNDKEKLKEELIRRKDNNKTEVSQWFLRRFAFQDIFHLHLVNYIGRPLSLTVGVFLFCLFVFPEFVNRSYWGEKKNYIFSIIAIFYFLLIGVWGFWKFRHETKDCYNENNILNVVRKEMVKKRTISIIGTIVFAFIILIGAHFLFSAPILTKVCSCGTFLTILLIGIQVGLIGFVGFLFHRYYYPVRWISNLHLFFPRLVAAITAAWLSLAIGNELFGTFFDSLVSWSTCIWLTVIVFAFVMYEINKMLPLEKISNKVSRCIGIISISYIISLVVGLFIINFTGERFLERSGVMKDFYINYVYKDNPKQVEKIKYYLSHDNKRIIVNEDTFDKLLLDELQQVHIVDEKSGNNMNHPIVTKWGSFFILRDFLIQFSFWAMFIGIFIQMLFEEKAITET